MLRTRLESEMQSMLHCWIKSNYLFLEENMVYITNVIFVIEFIMVYNFAYLHQNIHIQTYIIKLSVHSCQFSPLPSVVSVAAVSCQKLVHTTAWLLECHAGSGQKGVWGLVNVCTSMSGPGMFPRTQTTPQWPFSAGRVNRGACLVYCHHSTLFNYKCFLSVKTRRSRSFVWNSVCFKFKGTLFRK